MAVGGAPVQRTGSGGSDGFADLRPWCDMDHPHVPRADQPAVAVTDVAVDVAHRAEQRGVAQDKLQVGADNPLRRVVAIESDVDIVGGVQGEPHVLAGRRG